MLLRIKKILTTDLVKVSFFNSISTLIRMMTGFISVKIVAVLIGPPGIALLGQLHNFSTIILSISAGGINNGVTKHVAQYSNSPSKYSLVLSTAFRITLILSVCCGLTLIFGAGFFSERILKDSKFESVFYIFGATIILYALNALLVAVINGFKDFKKYVTVNITGSLVGLLFTIGLSIPFGVYGALVSMVTYQSVVFAVTLYLVSKSSWFKVKTFLGGFSKTIAYKLGNYSIMALASAILVPTGQLMVRNFILVRQSLDNAGIWEGMNRISNTYLMVITTSLSVYYLPRLAGLKTDGEVRKEVYSVYKFMVPFLLITLLMIFLFRNLIIHILFDAKFLGMQNLFIYQLAGDFFKMCTWGLGYLFLARMMTKFYVAMEFFGTALFVLLSFVFVRQFGAIGATMAFCYSQAIAFIVHLIIFRKLLFSYGK